MKRTTTSITLACAAFLAAFTAAPAQAGPFDAIYAFGDSLSDVGNIFAASSQLGMPQPLPPYANGQFSNGDVWLQTLAAQVGVAPLTASLVGGTDYAYGGSHSGNTAYNVANPTDLMGAGGQIDQYKAAHATADPNALYTIWTGSNDILDIPGSATQTQALLAGAQIIANIDNAIGSLASMGAKNFLILTVPDLGKTPGVISQGAAAASFASQAALFLDTALVGGYAALGIPSLASIATGGGLNIKVLDTYSLIDQVVATPGAFGLTNVTDACFTGSENGGPSSGTLCSNTLAGQNKYLFWDSIHPTAGVHAVLGDQAALALAVPEPATEALMLLGLGAVGMAARRRSRAKR